MLYRVLVVDNSNHDLRHYSMMPVFGECGFEISGHTADLGAAVSSALRREYDVLLCINRPAAVIAANLLKRAAKAKLQAPVIVLSKVNAANDMRDCFLLGAVDYLTEPVLEDDVRAALLRDVKAIGRNIASAEFDRAMKDASELIPPDSKNGSFTEKLREHLEKIQGGALTVEEAADYFGFNPDYFGRYFKSRAGMSFSEFYKRLTVDYARTAVSPMIRTHTAMRSISSICLALSSALA